MKEKYMIVVAHCNFSNGSMDEWISFYNSQAEKRSKFTSNETLGIVSDSETIFTWTVGSQDQLAEHGADPEVAANIARMNEQADVYEAREIQDSDGPGQYFGVWTFENETPQQWIDVWRADEKRLSRNEVFAIVNDNSVAVLLEAFGTPADHAQHLERPEVKEHIERINEKAQIWKVDPLSFD